jgi:hypothetical protein
VIRRLGARVRGAAREWRRAGDTTRSGRGCGDLVTARGSGVTRGGASHGIARGSGWEEEEKANKRAPLVSDSERERGRGGVVHREGVRRCGWAGLEVLGRNGRAG